MKGDRSLASELLEMAKSEGINAGHSEFLRLAIERLGGEIPPPAKFLSSGALLIKKLYMNVDRTGGKNDPGAL